ncbi:universal stress protein UspA [Rhodanobacter sp. C05]|nr:universal stress protein UspA [Rhodanobacter sp. C05]OOG50307.1 universal stress protein UspA [Rhodanobacter sp. C01]OOG52334.1 universal stress protein UspA [Rhodanobacter sp. C03]
MLALVTSTGPWSAALLSAIDLAARWNANVTGCYVPPSLREQRAYESDPTVISLLTDGEYNYPDESAAFHAFAKELGAQHTSWVVTHTAIAPTLRKLGAWHDLAIIERDMVGETGVFDILGEGMLSSRAPCLVLPPHWDDTVSFDRIVIGWNGTVEGTRALHSALPLLQLAKQVILVNGEVRTPYADQVGVTEPDPIVYLMHHGIAAKPHYINVPSIEAGKCLLQKAHEVRADLLVMGAYGHSRIRERVLGGATRYVMANADIPVFMQH